jgi:hypothetical protein
VSKRARIVTFGAAGLLVLAGSALAAFVSGGTGQIVAMALIGVGLVAVVGLLFFEVGLSEERAREQGPPQAPARGRPVGKETDGRVKPRLDRRRGQRRRLRRDGD